ncbi:MAG: AMP-binding protein [Pseudomonadota bacterium]
MEYKDRFWVKSYDPGVPMDIEIPDKTFVDHLEEGITNNPDRAALHYMGFTMTFGELDEATRRFGRFLKDQGLSAGDVVGINLPNVPQYLIALAGSHRAGLATTGISALLTSKELAHQLNDSGAKVLVIMDMLFEQNLAKIADQVPGLKVVLPTSVGDYLPPVKRFLGNLLKKIPRGATGPLPGKKVIPFKEVMANTPAVLPRVDIKPSDVCLIQYTGGTTGLPKGVELTHANLVANIAQGMTWTEFKMGSDVFCSGFPFFHQAGQVFGMVAMVTGNTQCLIPDPRNTGHIAGEIRTRGATVIANVPTLYRMLLDDPKFCALDFSKVRACISGAAPFSPEAIRALEDVVGKGKVLEVYGMTETSPLITVNPYLGRKKVGSVGLPLPNTLVRIVDVETGKTEMPVGQEGELVVNGPQVMVGYHNKPDETAHAVREHGGKLWLHTGDVARMDEDGFVFIVDRAKDMLNVGGYKVFSREVEDGLYQHPAVSYCAIVGLKNPKRPESDIVKAVIQLNAEYSGKDPEALKAEILEFCKKNMSPYKIPKVVEFTEAIPLTAVGKVDKKMLR